MRWSEEVRKEAIHYFELGFGWKAVGSKINVSSGLVKQWLYTYKALGKEALFVTSPKKYDYELKVNAAIDRVEHGLAFVEIMEKYSIKSKTSVEKWARLYAKGGKDALAPKKRGRKTKAYKTAHLSTEEKLKARILELELELEIQKRINALADELEQR